MFKNYTAIRSFNADVRRLLYVWALNAFAYFGVMGVLLNLYLLRLGFGVEFIGLFIASGQIMWAAMSLPAGALSRWLGLRNSILLGLVLIGTGMSAMLLVEWLPRAGWEPWLMGGWLLVWTGAAFLMAGSTPFMMLAAGPQRNYAFAMQSALIALMGFVGGTIGGVLPGALVSGLGGSLDDPAPYRMALWLAPLAYLAAILIFARAAPLRLRSAPGEGESGAAPVRLLVLLGVIVVLPAVAEGATRSFFNIFLDIALHISTAQIGIIMGIGQLLPAFVAMVAPYLLDRWGAPRTLALVGMGMSAALIVVGFSEHWALAGVGFAAVVAMSAIKGTATNIFSQDLVPEQWRSVSAAVISVGLGVGWASAAALGSYLIGAVGFRGFFLLSAGLAFVSTPILLSYVRRKPPIPEPLAGD
jgi:MFS family permease